MFIVRRTEGFEDLPYIWSSSSGCKGSCDDEVSGGVFDALIKRFFF